MKECQEHSLVRLLYEVWNIFPTLLEKVQMLFMHSFYHNLLTKNTVEKKVDIIISHVTFLFFISFSQEQ